MYKKVILFCFSIFFINYFSEASAYDYKSADFLAEKSIIVDNRKNPENFNLYNWILRQEISWIVFKLTWITENKNCKNIFKDVKITPHNSWACTKIESLFDAWIIAKNDFYRPEHFVTKAEALGFIVNSLYKNEYEEFKKQYKNTAWTKIVVDFLNKKWLLKENISDVNGIAERWFIFEILANSIKNSENKSEEKIEKTSEKNDWITTFSYHFPDWGYSWLQKFAWEKSDLRIPAKFGWVISYPNWKWPFPVALIIHWAWPDCILAWKQNWFNKDEVYTTDWKWVCPEVDKKNLPKSEDDKFNYYWPDYSHNYMWMTYLTQSLAKKWIIAVAFDVNIQNNTWLKKWDSNPIDNAEKVLEKNLELLKDLDLWKNNWLNLKESLKNKFDFNNLSIIWHSNWWVAAYEIGTKWKIENVKSLVLIQAWWLEPEENKNLKTPATLLIRWGCDEQLWAETWEFLVDELKKYWWKNIYNILIKWIWHWDVNTLWSWKDCNWAVSASKEVTREQTEEIISEITSSFIASKNKDSIKIPSFAEYESKSEDLKIEKVEKTDYKFISPKTVEKIFSKEKILENMPDKKDIWQGWY